MPLLPTPRKLPNNVVATWYEVLEGTFVVRTRKTTVRVAYYLDEAAAAEGAQPVEPPIDLAFDGADLDAMGAPELEVTQLLVALVQLRAPFAPEPAAG